MLGVGDRVTNNVLKENLEDTARLLVNQTRDTLDTATARQTTNGRLSDTCADGFMTMSERMN
jgi:hypothetical protein